MNAIAPGPGHVFISYAHEDSHQVDELHKMLMVHEIPVWRDKDSLWPGEDWKMIIRQAIADDALAFIACFSRASVNRLRGYQNEELTLAFDQMRKRRPQDPWLIPVRLDECDIPEYDIGGGRTLSSIHRVDLFGDGYPEAVERLVGSVNSILDESKRRTEKSVSRSSSSSYLPRSSVEDKSDLVRDRFMSSVRLWEERAAVGNWYDLTYRLTKPVPSLTRKQYDRFVELGRWLLARNWPHQRYPKVSSAFGNMLFVVQDLVAELNDNGDVTDDHWQIRREYKEIPWDPERYEVLITKYREAEWTILALTIELTKAVNWVMETVRAEVDPLYRFDEGSLLLFMADLVNGETYVRAEYNPERIESASPYVGVDRVREVIRGLNGKFSWQAALEID